MGRKKKKAQPAPHTTWCYYCERTFADEATLVQHQVSRHFKCPECGKKFPGLKGMVRHTTTMHKVEVKEVPNAIYGREDTKVEVYAMLGIPADTTPPAGFGQPETQAEPEEQAAIPPSTYEQLSYMPTAYPGYPPQPGPYGMPPQPPQYGGYRQPPPRPGPYGQGPPLPFGGPPRGPPMGPPHGPPPNMYRPPPRGPPMGGVPPYGQPPRPPPGVFYGAPPQSYTQPPPNGPPMPPPSASTSTSTANTTGTTSAAPTVPPMQQGSQLSAPPSIAEHIVHPEGQASLEEMRAGLERYQPSA
eukprot:m.55024 g.55024  ORF g.55024 m.55024 type:complete len:300 (-) comp11465_c0_seq1:2900-3799(-)